MGAPIFLNGMPLFVNGAPAMDPACCCGPALETCCVLKSLILVGDNGGTSSNFWGLTMSGGPPVWEGSQFEGCGTLRFELVTGAPNWECVLYQDGVEVARRNVPPTEPLCTEIFGDVTLDITTPGCDAGTKNITVFGPWDPCV